MRRGTLFILLALIIAGAAFRFAAGWGKTLWQDEAETTINSLQVLERGYPYDTMKGKVLYENRSSIPIQDEKYQFASTNYYGSKYERIKGWLTYYYQAFFLKLFGFSTNTARLPFVLLFPFSLMLIFVLARKLWNERTGIIAAALFTFSYFGVQYEYQSRYYSLVTFLCLLGLIAVHDSIRHKRWRDYFLAATVLIALFYTHIVATAAMFVFFFLSHAFTAKSWRGAITRRTVVVVALFLAATVPWLIVVRFWTVGAIAADMAPKILWLLLVGIGVLAWWLWNYLSARWTSWRYDIQIPSPVNFLLWFLFCVLIIKPLLTPEDSLGARLLLEVNVVSCILAAYCIEILWQRKRMAVGLVGLLAVTGFALLVFSFRTIRSDALDTRWVDASIAYFDAQAISHDTPIFVSYQQFPFLLYTDYNVDLIWSVRKSYLDTYPKTFYMLFNSDAFGLGMIYPPQANTVEEYNFFERSQRCSETEIYPHTTLLKCDPA